MTLMSLLLSSVQRRRGGHEASGPVCEGEAVRAAAQHHEVDPQLEEDQGLQQDGDELPGADQGLREGQVGHRQGGGRHHAPLLRAHPRRDGGPHQRDLARPRGQEEHEQDQLQVARRPQAEAEEVHQV